MLKPALTALGLLAALPALGEEGNWLYDLVDNSYAYQSIGDDTVLIEGENNPEICRFGATDGFFAAVAAGDEAAMEASRPSVACVPLSRFRVIPTGSSLENIFDLATALDESEGYISPAPGTLLIEGYGQIDLCHFTLPDAYFAALTAGEDPDEADLPSVACLPLNEVFQ
jgi:hypothetical protein